MSAFLFTGAHAGSSNKIGYIDRRARHRIMYRRAYRKRKKGEAKESVYIYLRRRRLPAFERVESSTVHHQWIIASSCCCSRNERSGGATTIRRRSLLACASSCNYIDIQTSLWLYVASQRLLELLLLILLLPVLERRASARLPRRFCSIPLLRIGE